MHKVPHKERALVVWWDVPEAVSFVELHLTPEEMEQIKRFHNQFVNCVSTPEELQKEINDYFYDGDGNFKYVKSAAYFCDADITLVMITGFYI